MKIFSLGNSIPTSSVVIDRQLMEQIYLFDENKKYISIEDAKAWIDICALRPRLKKISKPLGFYEMGIQNNISSFDDIKKQLDRAKSLYLYVASHHPSCRAYAIFFRYKLALYLFRNGYEHRASIVPGGTKLYTYKDIPLTKNGLKIVALSCILRLRSFSRSICFPLRL